MITAGIDVGYDSTKVVIEAGGNTKKYSFPSLVGAGAPKILSYKETPVKTVSLNGSVYTVGEDAVRYRLPLLTVRARNAIESVAYRALVKFAFQDINEDMLVVTGLPVEYYFHGDREIVSRVMMETVPEIKHLKVIPQPAGTFFDYVLDTNGSLRGYAGEIANSTIGIIDIGRYTTDFTVFDRMDFIANLSGSINMGVEHIFKAVIEELNDRYGFRTAGTEDIKEAVTKGYLFFQGNKIDVHPLLEKHVRKTCRDIESFIMSCWGTEKVEKIILTGGGAHLMKEINVLGIKPLVVQNPVMANATGFWKLARRMAASISTAG